MQLKTVSFLTMGYESWRHASGASVVVVSFVCHPLLLRALHSRLRAELRISPTMENAVLIIIIIMPVHSASLYVSLSRVPILFAGFYSRDRLHRARRRLPDDFLYSVRRSLRSSSSSSTNNNNNAAQQIV